MTTPRRSIDMAEPLFGSAHPIWPAMPATAFGYFQTPLAGRGLPLGAPTGTLTTDPYGAVAPLAALGGPDIGTGVTAPMLLSAVAMRRGQPLGPTSDQEVEDFIYDALDFLPGTSEVEVRCEGGRATLTGTVQRKRFKRDVGEIAWAIPAVNDVQNNVGIAARRRSRSQRSEIEPPSVVPGRKQA
jgi:BON domain-containing protein